MAHEIDQSVYAEGQAMFAVEPAWHRLGRVKPNTFTSSEAMQEIGLDFNVSKRMLQFASAGDAYSNITGPSYTPVEDFRATVRDDSNAVLGIVGKDFEPLQNRQHFQILDEAVATTGLKVQYESAGSLKGGRKVWALARLPEPITIASESDKVWQYFLALNGHDGSRAASFFPTTVRVVCANTAAAAEAGRERKVTWHHTANIEKHIPDMVAAIKGCIVDLKNWGTIAEAMAQKEIQTEEEKQTFQKLVTLVIEETIDGKSDEAKKRRLAGLTSIVNHFSSGNDPLNPGDEPTVWRAYNAVSTWLEHEARRYRSPETRFESLVFGAAAAMKSRAFGILSGLLPRGK
jgi:phage/plasmid-like protein (TIGR03299 family)